MSRPKKLKIQPDFVGYFRIFFSNNYQIDFFLYKQNNIIMNVMYSEMCMSLCP